mgnify:CR=1 FL=1
MDPNAPTNRLLLRATDPEDLKVIAACLQDAILPLSDACYLPDEHCFVLVVNRFRWEIESDDDAAQADTTHERVLCGVRFEGVRRVTSRGIDRSERALPLEILTMVAEEQAETGRLFLQLVFAGGGAIRLEVDRILCHLEDLDEAWPTRWRPSHPIETA